MTSAIRALMILILAVIGAACSGGSLELSAGDCFQDWEGTTQTDIQQVTRVETVDCNVDTTTRSTPSLR